MRRRKLAIQYSISNGNEMLMDERTDEHMTTRQLAGKLVKNVKKKYRLTYISVSALTIKLY